MALARPGWSLLNIRTVSIGDLNVMPRICSIANVASSGVTKLQSTSCFLFLAFEFDEPLKPIRLHAKNIAHTI